MTSLLVGKSDHTLSVYEINFCKDFGIGTGTFNMNEFPVLFCLDISQVTSFQTQMRQEQWKIW